MRPFFALLEASLEVKAQHFVCLSALLAVSFLVYRPGLGGGFIFDDYPNIVDNVALKISSLSFGQLKAAASSSSAGELKRPVAMASFALNEYFFGNAAYSMKLANVLLHLGNGLLLYFLFCCLLSASLHKEPGTESRRPWSAMALTALWLLLPINVSGVLYVVQRMEVLAQTFVLLGLLGYCLGRQQNIKGKPAGILTCWLALALATATGVLCKESAILMPAYAFLAELFIFRFQVADSRRRWQLPTLFTVLLFIPLILGSIWLFPRCLNPAAYLARPFTLPERLLTELRVVVDYILWSLLPFPHSLSFFHDDIRLSTSLGSPLTTLYSLLALSALAILAIFLRSRLPFFALGIFWFFAAQTLTATIIPLELVFEHRNYFASIGLLLAGYALVDNFVANTDTRIALAGTLIIFYAFVTTLRVEDWANPLQFAKLEVDQHPDSARASYELGRVYVTLSQYQPSSPFVGMAHQELDRGAKLTGASILPDVSLIFLANYTDGTIDPRWWQRMRKKLSERVPSQEDLTGLRDLVDCQRSGSCKPHSAEITSVFFDALSHPNPDPELLVSYADFVASQLADYSLAIQVLQEAIKRAPGSIEYKIDLALTYFHQGNVHAASTLLAEIEALNPTMDQRARLERFKEAIIASPVRSINSQ